MSQSPESDNSADDQTVRYQRGWKAFARLIAEGRSFSGHERNCCFLNLGDGKFADVSGVTGLDFLDDSRAVAVTDWDFDGRLDFWVSGRTSPRVRYLHNETLNDNHFVAVHLEGTTCQRDAIGARVELYLKQKSESDGVAPPRVLVKQLSAGDGYLSQSSKWIHFGYSKGEQIDRIVVHWPRVGKGNQPHRQSFPELGGDQHYDLVQGATDAKVWHRPPAPVPFSNSRFSSSRDGGRRTSEPIVAKPARDPLHRTVIVGKVPLPHGVYNDWQGKEHAITDFLGKPLLINLWSPTCAPCLTELTEWSDAADQVRAAELEIVALTVDALQGPDANDLVRSKQMLQSIRFPWSEGIAPRKLVQTLELMHHAYIQLHQELPLPSSFLLDRSGRLAVIYKGRVPIETLLADVALVDSDAESRRATAVPYPGRWVSKPLAPDPVRIAKRLESEGLTSDAIEYARLCIAGSDDTPKVAAEGLPHTRIDLTVLLGELLLQKGERQEATAAFSRAIGLSQSNAATHRRIGEAYLTNNLPREAMPHLSAALTDESTDGRLLYNVGLTELASRMPRQAIGHLKRAHALLPGDANVCFQLANALHGTGQTVEAVGYYREALEHRPGWSFAANNLAWILATHRDATVRNGAEAVRLAEALCQPNNQSDPSSLATLAAAYAEVDRFADAVRVTERASALAEASGQAALAKRLRERAAQFGEKHAIRE